MKRKQIYCFGGGNYGSACINVLMHKSIVTRKLEGVDHFHYYLCGHLKGGRMEIFMTNCPLISVIVPIYNVELYLRECIESILNQSYQKLEIILVNDGSIDGCLEICQEYEKLDKRIKLISRKNGGLVSARKAGVMVANGDYIGYVDADDWIEKEMYQKMYEKGIQREADLICVASYRAYSNDIKDEVYLGFEDGIYDKNDIEKRILPHLINTDDFFEWSIPLQVWRHLYKKELIQKNQFEVDDRIEAAEDLACCFPCYLQARSLSVINECLYNYRQRDNSMRRNILKEKNIGYKLLYDRMSQSIESYGLLQKTLKKQMIFSMYFVMLTCSNYLFIEQNSIAFPFKVLKHSEVVIYGAGVFGEKIYTSFKEMNVCNIKLWVDSNYKGRKDVSNPIHILEEKYDYILLAVMNPKSRKVIRNKLIHFGVEEKKIIEIDHSLFTQQYLGNVLNKISFSDKV